MGLNLLNLFCFDIHGRFGLEGPVGVESVWFYYYVSLLPGADDLGLLEDEVVDRGALLDLDELLGIGPVLELFQLQLLLLEFEED